MFLAGPETERLTHRAKTEADAAAFYALNSNSDVMKFTGDVGFESEEQAAQAIRDYPRGLRRSQHWRVWSLPFAVLS